MGALAWEQEPPKTHSVSRPFFDRGVGSSILASLSEAGGNDQHSSLSKPLPPRSQTCVSRLSECVHDFQIVHAAGQSCVDFPLQDSLIFVCVPAQLRPFSCVCKWTKSRFGRTLSRLGNRPLPFYSIRGHFLNNHINLIREAMEWENALGPQSSEIVRKYYDTFSGNLHRKSSIYA